jgi:hypothetical protein
MRLHTKSERIKVVRCFVSRSIKHAASFLSLFDTRTFRAVGGKCRNGECEITPGRALTFPRMPGTQTMVRGLLSASKATKRTVPRTRVRRCRYSFPRQPLAHHRLSANKCTMTDHEGIYLAVLTVCEQQNGLCMDVEEERVRLAQAIADALAH